MKEKLVKCAICKGEELEGNMFELETPNFVFEICLDCGIKLESKIEGLKWLNVHIVINKLV